MIEKFEELVNLSECPDCPNYKKCLSDGYLDKIKNRLGVNSYNDSCDKDRKITSKEAAARQAAAQHSTKLIPAVIRYAELTSQSAKFSDKKTQKGFVDEFENIQKEFLELLPLYRHPVNDKFSEAMIFFDPDCLEIKREYFPGCQNLLRYL